MSELDKGVAYGWSVTPEGGGFRWQTFSGGRTQDGLADTRMAAEFKARQSLMELTQQAHVPLDSAGAA